jgi:hypothetical protein
VAVARAAGELEHMRMSASCMKEISFSETDILIYETTVR